MGKGNLQRDENSVPAMGGIDTTDPTQVLPLEIDPATGRLLVTAIITSGGGGGGDLSTAAKGSTAAGNPTSTDAGADRELLDVILRDASGNALAVGGGTQYTDGDADSTPTGNAILGFDGTNLRAVTTDAAGDLQVDILTLPTVTVQATNLDIRDLNSASDSVTVVGAVTVSGTNIDIRDLSSATDSVTVVATDLDIRNLSSVSDSVTVTGTVGVSGNVEVVNDVGNPLPVNGTVEIVNDVGNAIPVSATNLDIRDLSSATDSVTAETELPAAVALADNVANPTAPAVGSFVMVYDGTTWDRIRTVNAAADATSTQLATGLYGYNGTNWDRLRSSTADGLDVDVTRLPADTYSAVSVDATASGDTNIATTAAGQTLRLYYICLSANGANSGDVTVTVKAGATTLFKVSLKAGAIWARNIGAGRRYLAGALGDDLIVTLSAAQTVHVSAEYEIL